MTAEEMLYRAETGYDFITGFSAAGISKKEWSLFLTQSQFEIIKSKLPVRGTDLSFEETELLSEQFSELISDAIDSNGQLITKPSLNQLGGIDKRSIFFSLPDDFLYGLSEKIDYTDSVCIETIPVIKTTNIATFAVSNGYTGNLSNMSPAEIEDYINSNSSDVLAFDVSLNTISYYTVEEVKEKHRVKAITHNYYIANVDNPHKMPHTSLAWRLKAKSTDGKIRHELIPYKKVKNYYLRYLRMPSPIIIYDSEYQYDDGEIQGVVLNTVTQSIDCILKDSICDIIINRAIVIAQINLGDLQAAQVKAVDSSSIN